MTDGYQIALNHYKTLKRSFLARVEGKARLQDQQMENNIEQKIFSQINSVPVNRDFQRAEQLESIITNLYSSIFDFDAIEKQDNEINIALQKIKNNTEVSMKSLKESIKQYLIASNNNTVLEKAIRSSFKIKNGARLQGGSTEDIYNRLVGVFAQKIKDNTKSVLNLLQNQRFQIAGYYHELAAFQATKKLSNHLKAKHIGSKNLAADIVYTTKQASKAIKDYEKTLENFQNSFSVNETVPINTDFYDSIQVFGNQVKSWNLNYKKARIQGYSISSQHNLRNSLPEWATQLESVQFFKQNPYAIITTFGPLNVMYFTGYTRWWTCDLIETAINNKYRLMFNKGEKSHKLTNMVKLDQKAWHWSRLYPVNKKLTNLKKFVIIN